MEQFARKLGLAATAVALCLQQGLSAQETTKDGVALTWTYQLAVVADSVAVGEVMFPAHTITVFESDGGTVMNLFEAEMKPVSREMTGSRQKKVMGAMLPAVADGPLVLFAGTNTDRKTKTGSLQVAFASNDSAPLADQAAAERYMHGLAVKFNKAVVQAQIDAHQQKLDKADDKLGSARSDKEKVDKRITKATSDVEKAQQKLARLQGDKAKVQGDVHGWEKKFALTNDPKDLKRLTKARQRLSKTEQAIAKEMQREAKAQSTLNKLQGSRTGTESTVQERTESKEDLQRIISELKRKQEQIR